MKPILLASSIADSGPDVVKKYLKPGMTCLFINTAGEIETGDKQWQINDRQGLVDGGLKVDEYTLSGKSRVQVAETLNKYDIVHVNGGNSFYLLQQMRKCGFDEIIRDYVSKKIVYLGSSAGSIVAGPDIQTVHHMDKMALAPELKDTIGLGLVNVCIMPHWGSDDFKDKFLNHRLEYIYRKGFRIILLNDDQYLVGLGGKFTIESIVD